MPKPTSKARLLITALFVEHQTPAEVAAHYGVHRAWVYKLKARYEAEGETALEPRSRRPKTSPAALSPEVVDLIVRFARNSPTPAWTPAPRPSPGTCSTTTATASPGPPSPATWPGTAW
jgi:transposase